MAPLPPDGTARFRVDYTVNGQGHTMEVRSGSSPATVGTFVDDLLTALGSALYLVTIGTVNFAASGSNIFNPVTTGIEGNTYGTGSGATIDIPKYFNFIGRSTGGRRVRMAVFGAGIDGSDYRLYGAEDARIAAALAVINGFATNLLAIDGLVPVWKPYVNMGYNAYWQREVRA